MLRKLIIAGLFVGGGVFFIKRVLPQLTGSKKADVELEDIDAILLARQRELQEMARKTGEQIESKIGDKDAGDINSWMFAPNIDREKIQEELQKLWNPNDLNSYSGLKGWSLGLPNVTVPQSANYGV